MRVIAPKRSTITTPGCQLPTKQVPKGSDNNFGGNAMNVRFSLTKASATVAAIAMLTFAGCGSQPNLTPAQQKAGDYAEMNFDLNKCLPIGANLYRCPAL